MDAIVTDSELFIRYRDNNDQEAFYELYCRHNRRLWRYFYSRGFCEADVEDFSQQVWMKVVNCKATFYGGNFLAWLWVFARFAWMPVVKLRLRRNDQSIDAIIDAIGEIDFADPKVIEPALESERREDVERVRSGLKRLTALEGAFIHGIFYEEKTQAIVGAEHGYDQTYVSKIYRRGLNNLRDAMAQRAAA